MAFGFSDFKIKETRFSQNDYWKFCNLFLFLDDFLSFLFWGVIIKNFLLQVGLVLFTYFVNVSHNANTDFVTLFQHV